QSGADLYFAQKDNRSTRPVVYRMRALAVTPERLAVSVENVTAVRVRVFTLFGPGDLRSVCFLDRLSPGVWGYYSLGWVGEKASFLPVGHASSFVNRAVAAYRHAAGVPTDLEPPYAR